MRAKYDISSKWLIEHYAAAMLKLAGVGPVARVRPLPGEVVQTRQLPDGLVEARITGRTDPVLCLIEVSTYPYSAVPEALLDDIALTYMDRRVIPEVVTSVLRERGNVRVDSSIRLASPLGTARLEAAWRVVNLWELNAADYLPVSDVGLAPWIPLTRIDGPADVVLKQCKDVIDAATTGTEQENLLNITHILAGLRFDTAFLNELFMREGEMIESPVLKEWFEAHEVKGLQHLVLKKLEARLGTAPADVSAAVRLVADQDRLESLLDAAYTCPTLDAFRAALTLPPAAN